MYNTIAQIRTEIVEAGRRLYERHLLDTAGGNLSVRVDDRLVCMTPRYSGQHLKWNLKPEDVLVVTVDAEIVDGSGQISRESKAHLKLHREFGAPGNAVIHAHARNILVFAAMNLPMPPVLEATRKFGEVPVVEYAPAHTANLSDSIVEAIRPQVSRINKQAAAAIAPWHGLFLMGKDLENAVDAVERLDTNAYILMMSRHLGGENLMAAQRAQLEQAVADFNAKHPSA
jgi:L-fuculose-phosphate aldolase